jgi:calmodulin
MLNLALKMKVKDTTPHITITEDELKKAWEFFDPKHTGRLTSVETKKRVGIFYKDVTSKEIRFLMNNQNEISFDELYQLLRDAHLGSFDPVKEAFKIYDPTNTGYVDPSLIRNFFEAMGFGQLDDEDMRIVIQTADKDKDGKISLDDFRALVPFGKHD